MQSSLWRSIVAPVGCSVVSSLPIFMVAALSVQLQNELGFDAHYLGLVVSTYFLAAAAASLPLGRVVESIGPVLVFYAACITSIAVLGAAATVISTARQLTIAMIPTGFSSAAAQIASNQFLSDRVPLRRQGAAFGLKQAANPLATMLAGLAVPTIAITAGWRPAFGLAAVLAVTVTAPLIFVARRQQTEGHDIRRRASIRPQGLQLLLALGAGLGLAAVTAMNAFLASTATRLGVSAGGAGGLLALGGLSAICARVVLGLVADRGLRGHFTAISMLLTVGSLGLFSVAASLDRGWQGALIPIVVALFGAGWGWNGLLHLGVVSSYRSSAGRATSVVQVGIRLGGCIGPAAFGIVAKQWSFAVAWRLCGLLALSAAGLFLYCQLALARRQAPNHV